MKIEEWQLGEESKIKFNERNILHSEWLNNIHKDLDNKIINKNISTEILTEQNLEKEKM